MFDASGWRERAAALRTAANTTEDVVTRLSLLVLADDCEALAKETERRSADTPSRDQRAGGEPAGG